MLRVTLGEVGARATVRARVVEPKKLRCARPKGISYGYSWREILRSA